MKLDITVYKEKKAQGKGKGFAGRELLVEGLLGVRYVGRLDGDGKSEVSANSVSELMAKIKEAVGPIGKERELQVRFSPVEGHPDGAQLEGEEINEVFRGMDSLMAGKK